MVLLLCSCALRWSGAYRAGYDLIAAGSLFEQGYSVQLAQMLIAIDLARAARPQSPCALPQRRGHHPQPAARSALLCDSKTIDTRRNSLWKLLPEVQLDLPPPQAVQGDAGHDTR